MFLPTILLSMLLALSPLSARPQIGNTPNANEDYSFSFEATDQRQRQARQESGFGDESEVVEGSYSYGTPEGVQVSVSYIADEFGYYPKGEGIHPAIQRALEQLRRSNGL